MLSPFISLTAVFSVLFVVLGLTAAHTDGHRTPSVRRHHQLHNRLSSRDLPPVSSFRRQLKSGSRKRPSCVKKPVDGSNSTIPATSTKLASITIATSERATTQRATSTKQATSTKAANTQVSKPSGGNGNNLGNGIKPANWPSATQAGAAPAATRTSPADPFLMQLSKSYNNADNDLYNQVHVGQMTYYGQGLGACGDTYDDSSFTAAVSKLMYDAWPGATAGEMNRNPICGPFVPGRKVINEAGQFVTAVPGPEFVNVGGDGLLNCDLTSQCHIPLTATVKHGDKTIQVKIVDRCEACAVGDIDLTPTAFAALADMSLGRTSVEWFFNKY